jgi:hypothetical protein
MKEFKIMKRYILVDFENGDVGVYNEKADLLSAKALWTLGRTIQELLLEGHEVVVKRRPDLTTTQS